MAYERKSKRAPSGGSRARRTDPTLEGETVEVSGIVSRVFFANERWMAGKIETADGEISFAGKCAARQGEEVKLRGVWKNDEKYGLQIDVREMVLDLPVDEAAIASFLARSAEFEGIGPTRAKAIAEAAGGDFEGALRDPAALAARAGVPTAVVTALAERWAESRDYNAIATNLARYGVTPARARKLIEAFGPTIVHTVETNPYWLIGRASGVGFRTVDKIALEAGVPKNAPGRVSAALQYVVKESERNGHTWFERGDLITTTTALLCFDRFEDQPVVGEQLDAALVAGSLTSMPLGDDGEQFAIFRSHVFDQDVRAFCVARDHGAERGLNAEWATEAYAKSVQPSLYGAQAHACAVAWASRFSVITGGAGVGKTYVVQAVYEGARQRGLTVALCATTGKAAKRMTEAVGAPATTIHRLLVCLPPSGPADSDSDADDGEGSSASNDSLRFKFAHDETNPIDVDMLIVDEVSMLNAELASDLFRAIDFSRTQVVFVGDHNQLPPVGAGALLRDLYTHAPCPIVELNQIVRQAGPLKIAVNEILQGRVHEEIRDPGKSGKLAGPWALRVKCPTAEAAEAEVARVFHELGTLHVEDRLVEGGSRPIDPVRDVLYLSPQKRKPAGVGPLNALVQKLACERDGRAVPERTTANQLYAIGVGDRVMWTRNDRELDIMNGTLGEVLAVLAKHDTYEVPIPQGSDVPTYVDDSDVTYQRDTDTPLSWTFHAKGRAFVVAWQEPGGTIVKPIPSDKIKRMDLAYAMTVHKAQGSEAPVVVCVCTSTHSFQLSRNLLYTGVSRARKACYIVGDMQTAQRAAKRLDDYRRRTIFSVALGTYADLIGGKAPRIDLKDDGWNAEE